MSLIRLLRPLLLLFFCLQLQSSSGAAERFELRSVRKEGISYGSILLPTGWYPEPAHLEEDSTVERFGFSPVTGLYPIIVIDISPPANPASNSDSESDVQTVSHSDSKPAQIEPSPPQPKAAPRRSLLAGGIDGNRYFDPVRCVTWSSISNEANSVVKIEFDREYRYQFQFILEAKDTEKSSSTIQAIMDNLRFDLKEGVPPPKVSRSQMQDKVQKGALVTFAFDRRETPQSRALYLSLAIGVPILLLTLLIWERILKSRKDRERITAAEEATQRRLDSMRF